MSTPLAADLLVTDERWARISAIAQAGIPLPQAERVLSAVLTPSAMVALMAGYQRLPQMADPLCTTVAGCMEAGLTPESIATSLLTGRRWKRSQLVSALLHVAADAQAHQTPPPEPADGIRASGSAAEDRLPQAIAAALRGASLAVRAGPGSGKTRLLVGVAEALAQAGQRVLCLSFTRSSAGEIAHRLQVRGVTGVEATTLHAWVRRTTQAVIDPDRCMVEASALAAEYLPPELVTGSGGRLLVHRTAKMIEMGVTVLRAYRTPLTDGQAVLATLRRGGLGTVPLKGMSATQVASAAAQVAQRLLVGTMDFDAVLEMALRAGALAPGPQGPRYDWCLVDEYQDLSALQLDCLAALAIPRMLVVGDTRQAIYAWRGGDPAAADRAYQMAMDRHGVALDLPVSHRLPAEVGRLLRQHGAPCLVRPDAPRGLVQIIPEDCLPYRLQHCAPGTLVLAREGRQLAAVLPHLARCGLPLSRCGSLAAGAPILEEEHAEEIAEGPRTAQSVRRVPQVTTPDPAGVTLSTIHGAKGLEAAHVVLVGSRLIPHPMVLASGSATCIAQEANVRYVAQSRASQSYTEGS